MRFTNGTTKGMTEGTTNGTTNGLLKVAATECNSPKGCLLPFSTSLSTSDVPLLIYRLGGCGAEDSTIDPSLILTDPYCTQVAIS